MKTIKITKSQIEEYIKKGWTVCMVAGKDGLHSASKMKITLDNNSKVC